LRAAEDDRRDAAAGAVAAILARHARDASLQSRSARAAVAAAYAPLLRMLVARRDEIFDAGFVPGALPGDASIPDASSKRNVLACFLSLARDADQNALWRWLVSDGGPVGIDPDGSVAGFERAETPTTTFTIASTFASTNPFGRARATEGSVAREPARRVTRPPRLVSFLRLLCDALEAFAFRAEAKDEYVNASSSGDASADDSSRLFDRSGSSSLVAEGHRSTAVTLVVLELLRRGGVVVAAAQKREDAFWAKRGGAAARRRGGGAVGAMFGRGGSVSREAREARERAEARSARAARTLSPAVTFFEGSLGVLLTAMRFEQSEEAWRALGPFLRRVVWDRRADLLRTATYDPEATANAPFANDASFANEKSASFGESSADELDLFSLENAFPPAPAAPPGVTPHAFLETASALLLRAGAGSTEATRAEATSCVRALLEACVDLTGSAVALRPTLTYALCAALYDPLGAAARRGALKGELASLRLSRQDASAFASRSDARKEKKAREDWEKATRDVLGALEAAEARLRALAVAATGPRASLDVETVVDTEIAVARAFAWAPAAHCKALRSLSARLEAGSHWVEAAEAAATAAVTAMRALTHASGSRVRNQYAPACVWREHDASALADVCASLRETEAESSSGPDHAGAAGARCGVEEISEEKVLAHLAEATRLFVKGGHLEAAARVAKTVLPAWEKRRAFGDLARAHEGVAGVYRALHSQPPAGAAGAGAFGALPPPPGPPPPPATHYRVMLVGRAWDALGVNGKTWIHREPRDRTLGEMLRRLQTSLTPAPVDGAVHPGGSFPAIAPVPASGDAGDGACVRVTAVEPVFEASQSWLKRRAEGVRPRRAGHETRETSHLSDGVERSGGSGSRADPLVIDGPENDEASFAGHGPTLDAEDAWDGGGFPTARAFVHDAPFTREPLEKRAEAEAASDASVASDASAASGASAASDTSVDDASAEQTRGARGGAHVSTASPAARALRAQWRRRVTSRVAGRFPGLRARLEVTGETVTEMPPAVSTAEMLDAQRRAIAASAEAWETLSRNAHHGSSAVVGGLGSAEKRAADDGAAARAAESALGALRRSLQGSLAAGVNGGVPTIVEAFFPADAADAPETAEEHRLALVDALERFVGTCARAVETHGRAAREAAAKANAAAREAKAANKKGGRDAKAAAETAAAAAAAAASVERMQGMFVRCAAEVRRDLAMAVARAEARRGAGDGEGSE
jgi:hypothetical protein